MTQSEENGTEPARDPEAEETAAEAGLEPTADESPQSASPKKGGGMSSQLVAVGILFSRIAGLIRNGLFTRYFGTSESADAFNAALRMPNLLQNLLGEGVLSASFIPVYSELLHEGREEEAGRVAGAIFALLFAVAGGIAVLGILAAPFLVHIFTPGFEGFRYDLTVKLIQVLFPMTGILVLSAWALGILNSHRHFFVPYVAPVLWNAAIIATLLIFGPRFDNPSLAMALAWGAVIGGVLQFGIQLPWVLRVERQLKIRWDMKLKGVRVAARNAGPAVLGRGVVQVSAYIDQMLASLLAAGAVSVIYYATTLFVLPVSLFGMSVAAAELPELSRQRKGDTEALRKRIDRGVNQIAFFVVPSTIAYFALGDVVVATLYQRGEFGHLDTLLTAATLAAFTTGLLASTRTRLFSSAFYAMHDARTPAIFATVRVVLAAGLGAGLMFLFQNFAIAPDKPLGPVGLALGAGIAAWVEWYLLRRSLRKKIGEIGADNRALRRMFLAAILAAAAGRGLVWVLPALNPILTGLIVLPVYGAIYLALTNAFGVGQAAGALTRFIGKLRGK